MDLTIIVPCLNEIKILEDSIKRIREVLDISKYKYEIIIIDDGSADGTKDLAKNLANKYDNIKFINHEKNKGRGITVDEGIRNAKGKVVGYIDVDLETPASYILSLVLEIEKGADIATAHRHYKFNLPYTHRWVLSKGYNFLVRLLLNVKLKDTETGCKFFNKKKILPVLDQIKKTGWFWDTEIMIRSLYAGLKIKEVPTVFLRKGETGTTVSVIKDSIDYFFNLLRFRKEMKKKLK